MITTWTGSLLVCSRFCCFFFYFYWLALPPSLTATPRLAAPWSSWGPHHVPCAELAFDATLRKTKNKRRSVRACQGPARLKRPGLSSFQTCSSYITLNPPHTWSSNNPDQDY
ncbi:hypothetical protein IWX46DRAFT_304541 [Phyllosticta citricarpa]|uniref:Secreted protein n=1 Tax=Phyllosticta citricarpa TaxID=55181 RepID=A0ABR1LJD1_9PEZI